MACRLGMPRISRIERRLEEEYRAALEVVKQPGSGLQAIVLGNSLLNAGIRFDEAHRLLLPDIDARRLMVFDTSYCDWYYGMRRLFAEGSRPDVVILVLTPTQLAISKIRGNYFGYHLMRMADLFSVANDVGLSNTQTSNLAFANLSAYFGLGGEARKWLAGQVFADLPGLTKWMVATGSAPLTEEQVYSTCLWRLRVLRELTAQYGSKLVLVIPPTTGSGAEPYYAAVRRAGSLAGVSVVVPVQPNTLGDSYYSDRGFHLNDRGAEIFTASFVEAIRRELGVICRERTARAAQPDRPGRTETRLIDAVSIQLVNLIPGVIQTMSFKTLGIAAAQLKAKAPGPETKVELADSTPEDALKTFLLALAARDEATLLAVTPPHAEFDLLLKGPVAHPDQLVLLKARLEEKPMKRLKAGDPVRMPDEESRVIKPADVREGRVVLWPSAAGDREHGRYPRGDRDGVVGQLYHGLAQGAPRADEEPDPIPGSLPSRRARSRSTS